MQVNMADPLDPTHYRLWAGPSAAMRANNPPLPVGMFWQAKVTTPATPAFGTGTLELVQIVMPNLGYTTQTIPVQTHNDPLNGVRDLDTTYPYGNAVLETANPLQETDLPGLPLTGAAAGFASATFKSAFTVYLMYEPPNSTQFVPLASFVWNTDGSATIPTTNNWADYPAQHNGSDLAGAISPSGTTDFIGGNAFPYWANVDIEKPF